MCKSVCQNNCNKCVFKNLESDEDLPADVHLEFDFEQPKPSAMSKVVGDLVKTVVMLHEDHQEELTNTLLHDASLYDNLDKIEHLLWLTRQQRK